MRIKEVGIGNVKAKFSTEIDSFLPGRPLLIALAFPIYAGRRGTGPAP